MSDKSLNHAAVMRLMLAFSISRLNYCNSLVARLRLLCRRFTSLEQSTWCDSSQSVTGCLQALTITHLFTQRFYWLFLFIAWDRASTTPWLFVQCTWSDLLLLNDT